MSDYFEQKAMKALKRLQSMRNTALFKKEDMQEKGNSQSSLYWEAQYHALDQAISIVIDPDQLTIWNETHEKIQSE